MLGTESPEARLNAGVVEPILTEAELVRLRGALPGITVQEELIQYLVHIVRRTRSHEAVLVGAGPPATQALLLAARAYAAIQARDFVTPDDIKEMAVPVLEHRLILRPEFELEGLAISEVVAKILEEIAVPR